MLINLTTNATHNILLFSLLLHVGRKLDKPELVGRDGASFPRWCRLRLDQVTARNRCRRFPGVSRLRERFDILGRSWLQAWLPKLLKIYREFRSKGDTQTLTINQFQRVWCLLIMANSLPFEYWIIDALVTEYNSQIWIIIRFYYNRIIKYQLSNINEINWKLRIKQRYWRIRFSWWEKNINLHFRNLSEQ